MATEQNADMVTKAWTALVKGDADAALANMSDEISWVIPGHLPGVSGLKRDNGKPYENEYCFVYEIENGKIRRIREYVDMLTVKETLMS